MISRNVFFAVALLLLSGMTLGSCSKDEDLGFVDSPKPPFTPEPGSGNSNALYYVRYHLDMRYYNDVVVKTISFITESGVHSIMTGSTTWEGTYGPIPAGTTVKVMCRFNELPPNSDSLSIIYGSISACTGDKPFIVKKEGYGHSILTLEYKLD